MNSVKKYNLSCATTTAGSLMAATTGCLTTSSTQTLHAYFVGFFFSLTSCPHLTVTIIKGLDPPFVLYFSRLVIRTFLRLLGLAPPCSPGCEERWGEVFSVGKQSIVWWCWTNHTPVKKKCTSEMQESGDEGGKWVRLGGWGGEVDAWIKRVESFAKAQ